MFYDRAKKLKAKYTALHATVVKTYKATQELHKSVKEKNSQLLAEKIKLERQKISQVEEKANADKLRRARDMTKLRRHDEAEKLTNLLALKQEKLQDRKMNEKHVDRLKLENEKLLRPQIEAVNEDIKKLQVRLVAVSSWLCSEFCHIACALYPLHANYTLSLPTLHSISHPNSTIGMLYRWN